MKLNFKRLDALAMTLRSGMRGDWWFNRLSAGATGTQGLRDVLQGSTLTGTESFVREVVQNSLDAQRPSSTEPVEVSFRSEIVAPGPGRRLREFLLSASSFKSHLEAFEGKDRFPMGELDALGREGVEVQALYVEDRGTVGLGGRIGGTSDADHFTRLVYFFGQTHAESTKGGAFGFGKSVLSTASKLRTVIYYSRPRSSLAGTRQPSRLIAVSLFPGHEVAGREYTGYALCGREVNDVHFPIHPIEGEEADELAGALGFSRRDPADHGTSMMIVGCSYDINEIRASVEKWWWPRIIQGGTKRLHTAFRAGDELLPGPDPKAREDLRYFVRAYERLLDRRPNEEGASVETVRGLGRRELGKLSLLALPPNQGDDEADWYVGRMAAFRGLGLVVQYMDLARSHLAPVVGVFVADEEIDPILRRAEPPTHDRWAKESTRLIQEEREHTIVEGVERQCRKSIQAFQKTLEPEPPPSIRRFGALEHLLGQLFKRGNVPGPVPPGDQRPVHLHVEQRRDHASRRDEAVIEVRHRVGFEAVEARLEVEAHVLGDANRRQLEKMQIQLRDDRGKFITEGTHAEHVFTLLEGENVKFSASAEAREDSIVRFRVRLVGV